MSALNQLISRNIKLFFKDKGLFFTSLITPIILLVLYATFLKNVYAETFESALIGKGIDVADKLIEGCVGGELISSILAVCCVTVTFCSNFLMVQDKVNGSIKDLTISPVKKSTLAFGYYIANLISTLIICYTALAICLLYVAKSGWYLTANDVLRLVLDVLLLVLFGSALSSIINHFLTSQGQISAVGTIVSSGYGFICGAYMPISQFSDGLQKALSFLPGTYATSLIRTHALRGCFEEMQNIGFPDEAISAIKDAIDCNIYFFDNPVGQNTKLLILCGTIVVLITIYILLNILKIKKEK